MPIDAKTMSWPMKRDKIDVSNLNGSEEKRQSVASSCSRAMCEEPVQVKIECDLLLSTEA